MKNFDNNPLNIQLYKLKFKKQINHMQDEIKVCNFTVENNKLPLIYF